MTKRPNHKSEDDDASDRRRDDTLRNMLRTKPKPHEDMKKGKPKRPTKKPGQ